MKRAWRLSSDMNKLSSHEQFFHSFHSNWRKMAVRYSFLFSKFFFIRTNNTSSCIVTLLFYTINGTFGVSINQTNTTTIPSTTQVNKLAKCRYFISLKTVTWLLSFLIDTLEGKSFDIQYMSEIGSRCTGKFLILFYPRPCFLKFRWWSFCW
jgi:hypothetical protein